MITTRARWTAAVCGLLFACAAPLPLARAQQPAAAKPVAVVVVSGYDALMNDVNFIGSLAGQQQASQNIEQILMMATQQKGLAGLDKSKPIGAIVQHDGTMPSGGICIPVTDLNALLEIIKPFGVTSQDVGNGLLQINAKGQNVFAKNAGGWALVSLAPPMLEALPADPAATFAPLVKDYDLAVQLHVQNVPEAYRQQAVDMISMSARQGLSKKDNESDEAYAERQQAVEGQVDELKRVFNELDQLTVGLSLDGEQHRAYLDIGYTAVPGTKLASDLAASSKATTNFAGFFQPDAAMTMSFAQNVTGADAAQIDQLIAGFRSNFNEHLERDAADKSEETRAAVKDAMEDLLQAVKATLAEGVMDGGAVLTLAPNALTFVAGGHISDPAKVESGLKKIAAAAKKEHPGAPEVKWSSASHGDVTFHTVRVPVPDHEEEARQMFGDALDVAVGIGKNSVYIAIGRDCLAAVKKVIDASTKVPGKPVAPMEMTVALGQIINAAQGFAKDEDKGKFEMIANMLTTQANGRDHFRVVTQPTEHGVRTRIEAEEGVLRTAAMAIMQAQMQAAGAR